MKKIYWVLIFGLVLRLVSINQSFWLDEATTANVARNFNFKEIVLNFSINDFHPPVYYFTAKLWGYLFGYTELGLRSLSAVAGMGSVYLVYLIGREYKEKIGLVAATLLATSGLHIYYSQEARMYALASFWVCMAIFSYVKIMSNKRGWWGSVFALSIFLMVGTHYLTIFLLPVFWILSKDKFKQIIWSHNILVIFLLTWSPIFYKQFFGGLNVSESAPLWWQILGQTDFKEIVLVPVKFMIGRIGFDNKFLYGFVVGLFGLIYGYPLYKSTEVRSATLWSKYKLTFLWLVVPTFLAAVLGLFIPVFSYFRLLYVLPALYLIAAIGVENIQKYKNLVFILLVLMNLGSSLYYLGNDKFHREDWRAMVESVSGENSLVLFVKDSQMEAMDYYGQGLNYGGPEKLNDNYDEIWLMRYVQPIFDPQDSVRKNVEDIGYKKVEEKDFNGVVVWRYNKI